jgi:hypothetical protein
MMIEKRPRGRPRKHPEGGQSPSVSRETLKILGKRVFGRKDCMPGVLIRVGGEITQAQAEWAINAGLAVWVGDAQGELEAADRRRMMATKAAAESAMQRFDSMPPEDREYAREQNPDEGSDVS